MFHMLTDYHKNRYKWVVHAQREYLHSFVVLNIQENVDLPLSEDRISLTQRAPSFCHLTELPKVAERTRKQVFAKYDKKIAELGDLIEKTNIQIEVELKKTASKENQLFVTINQYKEFLTHIEMIITDLNALDIERFVHEIIPVQSKHKKASAINGCALKLEQFVQTRIKKQISDLKEKAHPLQILSIKHLQIPGLDSIPEIHPKIDTFWFNSQYQKSLQITREYAASWVEKMHKAYLTQLTFTHDEGTQHLQQLLIDKETLQQMKDATLQRLKHLQAKHQEKKELLIKQQEESDRLWKHDCEHAKNFFAYLIKHWLLYKDELKQKFLYVSVEERWFVSQYLLFLQQDGEKMIESMNIGES